MTIASFITSEMNSFQRALADIFANDLIDANQRVVPLKKLLEGLIEAKVGPSQYDEGLKQLGTSLGFRASRPDQEFNQGPDVLWEDDTTSTAIAFETKIEKEASSSYSKKEVGQSHNHLQWVKDNKKVKLLGLAIVGECKTINDAASPSEHMFFVPKSNVAELAAKFHELLIRIDLLTPLERRGSISALKDSTEFSVESVWNTLSKERLKH